jgi:hypothetical protein
LVPGIRLGLLDPWKMGLIVYSETSVDSHLTTQKNEDLMYALAEA